MCSLLSYDQVSAQPTITSFSPTSGPIGTEITITGSGFDPNASNNIVFFGATQAVVSTATTTILNLTVPDGATYQPLTVLVDGLIAHSSTPFVVTFDDANDIDSDFYTNRTEHLTGSKPISVALGDLDGDGKSDLVFANSAGSTVSVLRNITMNPGAISFDAKIDITTGPNPFDVAIGDLDGDGKLDIVTTNSDNATLSVLRNTSTGATVISFDTKEDFNTGDLPFAVSMADLDGDGRIDLATANLNSNSISILRNTSTGEGVIDFAVTEDFQTATEPIDVAIGDLNEDGKLDLAIANWNSTSISLVTNNSSAPGMISFNTIEDIAIGYRTRSIALGDLNGDDKTDIATTHPFESRATVIRNTNTESGSISFTDKYEYITGQSPVVIEIIDLNGDGKPDLVAANETGNSVSLLENISAEVETIHFAEKVDFTSGPNPWGLALGDLDADGKPDMITANYGGESTHIWRNNAQFNTPLSSVSFDDPSIGVYPNPTKGWITTDISLATSSEVTFEIRDLTGSMIKRENFLLFPGSQSLTLDLSNTLQTGVFLYAIWTSDAMLFKGKLIME